MGSMFDIPLFSAVADIPKGRGGMVLVREKQLRGREKGGRETLSSPPFSFAHGIAPTSLSFSFRTPSTHARDNQVIL